MKCLNPNFFAIDFASAMSTPEQQVLDLLILVFYVFSQYYIDLFILVFYVLVYINYIDFSKRERKY